jgi:hypothetical protein
MGCTPTCNGLYWQVPQPQATPGTPLSQRPSSSVPVACRDVSAVGQIDWDTWYHKPGMPPVDNTYDTSLAQAAYDLATRWVGGGAWGGRWVGVRLLGATT